MRQWQSLMQRIHVSILFICDHRCASWSELSANEVEGEAGSSPFSTEGFGYSKSEGCLSLVSHGRMLLSFDLEI